MIIFGDDMDIINNRYKVLELINTTFNGKEYKVIDKKDNKIYSLSLFNKNIDEEFINKYSRAFYNYTKIIHPYITRDYKFDIVSGSNMLEKQYFYVYEYIDKDKCVSYLSLDFNDRISVLEKIIYALKYLHFKKYLYEHLIFRNINIIKNSDGSLDVKLANFGHIYKDHTSTYNIRNIESRLISFYGADSEISDDVFSLASIAYYLITGKDVAFENINFDDDIKPKYPKLYVALNNAVGPYEYRPKSIDDIWNTLVDELGISNDFWDKEYYKNLDFKVDMIAQKEQTQQIKNAIIDYYRDKSVTNTIFVKASWGIGKTRLLSEIKSYASFNGLNPIYCDSNIYQNKDESYGCFGHIIRKILQKFKLSEEYINMYGDDIVKIVPEFAKEWNIKKVEKLKIGDESEFGKIASRIILLINELSRTNKFLILLDDADKMNVNDATILYHLISNANKNKPFLLATVNNMPVNYDKYEFEISPISVELSNFNHYHTVEYLKRVLFIDTSEAQFLSRDIYPLVHGNPKSIQNIIECLIENNYIYIGKQRKYIIKLSNLDDIDYTFEQKYNLNLVKENLQSLSKNASSIVKFFSVYAHKLEKNFAKKMLKLSDADFDCAIKELLDKKILRELNSLSDKYYEFYDYKLFGIAYIGLSDKEKLEYHHKCKLYYESLDRLNDFEFDLYILHLINSNNKDIAIKKLIEKSQNSYNKNKYYESLGYLDFAKSFKTDICDVKIDLDILVEESKLIDEIGEIDKLMDIYIQILEISNTQELIEYHLYGLINVCNLYLSMRKMREFEKTYSQLLHETSSGYEFKMIESKFEIEILQLRYLVIMGKTKELKHKAEKFLAMVNENDYARFYYMAKYYIAVTDNQLGNFDNAINNMIELSKKIDETKYPRQMIMCYALIGEVYHYSIYDDEKAYEYLSKAEKLVIEHNLEKQNGDLYLNMARTIKSLGDLNEAYVKYRMAEKISSFTRQYSLLFEVLNGSVELLSMMGKFQLAESMINRFKQISIRNDIEVELDKYYNHLLLEANIYIGYRMFDFADKLIQELENSALEYFYATYNIKYFLTKFYYKYIMSKYNNTDYDFDDLYTAENMVMNPIDEKYFMDFIFVVSLDAYILDDFNMYYKLQPLLQLDNIENNNLLMDKIKIIEIIGDNKNVDTKKLKMFIIKFDKNALSYLWRFYYILAKIEKKLGNDVEALCYYAEAFNKYSYLIGDIPKKRKLHHIEHDIAYNNLVSVLNKLKYNLYSLEPTSAVDMYFQNDTVLYKHMINDDRVKNVMGSIYISLHRNYFPTVNDYINIICEDHIKNIENMVLMFVHSTLSERGYLIIVDENGNKVKVFSAMGDELPQDFNMFISGIRKPNDYIFIQRKNHSQDMMNNKMLYYEQSNKNIMIFPVCMNENINTILTVDKDSYLDIKQRIVGYVYLESSLVVNKLDLNNLFRIKTYDGLNTLIINNYNMYVESSIDKLTGVLIRSLVEKHINNIIKKMKSIKYPFSVLMIDIDKFKTVNDTYGHRRGDKVLIRLGAILKTFLREVDLVGRYGGEEFIAVLADADSDLAYEIANNLRIEVEEANLLDGDRDLTISIGVSSYPIHGENFAQLVENADKALYESKNSGRNRVTVYSEKISKIKSDASLLIGLLSSDVSENSIKVKSLVDMLSLLSYKMNKYDKLNKALEILLDVIDGNDIFILREGKEDIYVSKFVEKSYNVKLDDNFRKSIISSDEGGCFVDWENSSNISDLDKFNRDWNSYVFSKIVKNGVEYATMLARSSVGLKEYSYKDYYYILSLSSIFGTILEEDE